MKFIYCLLIALLLGSCATGEKQKPEEFIVDLNSHNFQIGEIETQLMSFIGLGPLKKSPVAVLYYPNEDAVCLRYRHEFITYNQYWNRSGRQLFIKALEKYNEDYDARNLNSNAGSKGRKAYGTADGYLIWQQFSFSVLAKGSVKIEIGYIFKENLPYFYMNQLDAEYIDPLIRDHNRTSAKIPFHFTRAQAAGVAALFDQSVIDEFNKQNSENKSPAANIDTNIDSEVDYY